MDHVKKFLHVEGVIGQGAFGRVLVATATCGTRFALKCVHNILKPERLANELRHLRDLGGKCNIVQMHTAHFNLGSLYIVMELIEPDKFIQIVVSLDHEEIMLYMKNLLIALHHVHSQGIMHRDIKPANFLFNRKNKKFLLVDFGLAQKVRVRTATDPVVGVKSTHYIQQSPARKFINLTPSGSPTTKRMRKSNNEPIRLTVGAYESPVTTNDNHTSMITMPRRVFGARCDCRGKPKTCNTCLSRKEPIASKSGTPGYKAPEILLRYQHQNTAIDIWSAGVMFACLLSGHYPFFRDVDDFTSLAEIITILGSQRVTQAAKALGIRLNVKPEREPVDIVALCRNIRQNGTNKRQIDIPGEAFDLLIRMLDPNPLTRITAHEALGHPWFGDITDV